MFHLPGICLLFSLGLWARYYIFFPSENHFISLPPSLHPSLSVQQIVFCPLDFSPQKKKISTCLRSCTLLKEMYEDKRRAGAVRLLMEGWGDHN